MPVGRLIDQLKLAPLVWGRCFSVATEDLEYASDALKNISSDLDISALREIEGLSSARARARNVLLSGNARNRPVGPFSSVLLEALSIRRRHDGLSEETLGGWLCHLREEDAISAAQERFTAFSSTSEAGYLSKCLQVYSARIAGRFATSEDVLRLLVGGRSANDPQTISDTMTVLQDAGIDGIVLGRAENPKTALVLRGCALSQLRQVRRIEVLWTGDRATIKDDSIGNPDGEPRIFPANPGILV